MTVIGFHASHEQVHPSALLQAVQRAEDGRLARRRVVAEHGIGKVKVWRAASERHRNPVSWHALVMKNVAGLHNLMFASAADGWGPIRLQAAHRLWGSNSNIQDSPPLL